MNDPRPSKRLAVLTCMDCRIDPLAALGLRLGEAHVLRNAGARVTDDALRSLAVSTHVLGVDSVVLMQHTGCGMTGVTDDDLRERTGAGVAFLTIDDHTTALKNDVETLAATPYLAPVKTIEGYVYDLDSGTVEQVTRWER